MQHITKQYGTETVVHDVSVSLPEGQTLCLVGTSGSGKTTLLKLINRLVEPTSGTIEVFGENVAATSPIELRRNMGYVIQGGALFPHWTVGRNITTVPRLLGWERSDMEDRISELLELVQLPDDYRNRYPAALSGGEQQRVGIARALAARPRLLLMDEPFSALDPITRNQLQQEMLRLKETLKITTVFVTHDVPEALMLGDLILVLDGGKVQQIGTPKEITEQPANAFVASFLQNQLP